MTFLVVALALIPEAISFSIIAGVDPKVGLYASAQDGADLLRKEWPILQGESHGTHAHGPEANLRQHDRKCG